MTARSPSIKRTQRIASLLAREHPDWPRPFIDWAVRESYIRDLTDSLYLAEARHKAEFYWDADASGALGSHSKTHFETPAFASSRASLVKVPLPAARKSPVMTCLPGFTG
jgi:hypothetical protein